MTVQSVVFIAEVKAKIDNVLTTGKKAYKCIDDALKSKAYDKKNLQSY